MSRWGKPTKNKKRKDARYFLTESADDYHDGFDPEENPPRIQSPKELQRPQPPYDAEADEWYEWRHMADQDMWNQPASSEALVSPAGDTPEDVAKELVSSGAKVTPEMIDQAVLEAGVLDDQIPDFADRVWEIVDQIQDMGAEAPEIPQIDEGVNIDGLITMLEQGDPLVVSDLSKAFKAAPGQEVILNTELADDAVKAGAKAGAKSSVWSRAAAAAGKVTPQAAALAGGLEAGDLALKHGGADFVPGAENYSLFSQRGLEGVADLAKEFGPAIVSGAKNIWDDLTDPAPEGGLNTDTSTKSGKRTADVIASPGGASGPMGWTLEESHLNQIIREELGRLLSEQEFNPESTIPAHLQPDPLYDWAFDQDDRLKPKAAAAGGAITGALGGLAGGLGAAAGHDLRTRGYQRGEELGVFPDAEHQMRQDAPIGTWVGENPVLGTAATTLGGAALGAGTGWLANKAAQAVRNRRTNESQARLNQIIREELAKLMEVEPPPEPVEPPPEIGGLRFGDEGYGKQKTNESQDPFKRIRDLALKPYGSCKK